MSVERAVFKEGSEKVVYQPAAEYDDERKGSSAADDFSGYPGDDATQGHDDAQQSRTSRRNTLALAARLQAELLQGLERLEDRQWSLQGHIRSVVQRRCRHGFFGPAEQGGLHAGKIAALQEKVERACEGLDRLGGRDLEDRCFTLAGFAMELSVLITEVESRERAWGLFLNTRQFSRMAAAA